MIAATAEQRQIARALVGKAIRHVSLHPVPDGRGGAVCSPVIEFFDGSRLLFDVQETDVGIYGVRFILDEGSST